jgi:hypothetical protein
MFMKATALFPDRHSAHAAIEQLAQAGFARDEVSVAMSDDTHQREFRQSGPRSGSGLRYSGVLGAIVSSLAVFAGPGPSSLRVGGPLLGALMRAGALSLALATLGLAEPEARALREGLLDGNIVVGVHATRDRAGLAIQLLELAGGETVKAAA